MESSLVAGPVAEEAYRHPVVVLQTAAQCRAHGHRDRGAEDARLAQDADAEVGQVHRAALALADAGLLAQQLGHCGPDVAALGDGVSVRAVVAGHPVVVAQGHAGTHGHRLLPDVGVGRANDLAALHQADYRFLEVPDAKHSPHHFH